MKHLFTLFLIACTLLPIGCDKTPRHGLLDGQWQLLRVDDQDLSQQQIYWRFQLDLVQFYPLRVPLATDIPYTAIHCRFQHRGDSIHFTQPFLSLRAEGRDSLLAPDHGLDFAPIGLSQLPVSFKVAQLTSSSLLLQQGHRSWQFRKF